jgi:CDP-glucose 4,6-dehydratase
MYFEKIFSNKKVLVTGHTGFKGSWLSAWLNLLGAKVIGISNDIPSDPCNYEASQLIKIVDDHRIDIRDADAIRQLVQQIQPDFVFHLAAQALVRPSYENPLETLSINALGTANILDALRILKRPVVAVMITSDKAYDNVEWVWGYRETDRLGGKDPYSASKGMAELAVRTYFESYFKCADSKVRLGIARAGNVIGGGDWAVDRIVPDCMKAWSQNNMVDIRSPWATRPWQHVLEPLSGYLALGSELHQRGDTHGEPYNFGPSANQDHSVAELIDEMAKYWNNVRWNDISQSQKHLHEAGLLKLNCDKALFDLKWLPTLKFEETVRLTIEWYKTYYQGSEKSMYSYTVRQIEEYTALAQQRSISWAENNL